VSAPFEPTPEQGAAIAVEGSAAVRAGAGSGKTAVLARRFVHLLRPGSAGVPLVDDVSQILAITFTEKAAAEMKKKVRDVLGTEIEAARGADRARWIRLRRDLLGAQISTIHAFCARVLRENPIEAGIDPRAAVLDEHETRAYLENAVESELLARLRAGDLGARELVLRFNFAGGRNGGAVGLVTDFLARLGRTGHDAAWLVSATEGQAANVSEAETALRAAADRVLAIVGERVAVKKQSPGVAALAARWSVFVDLLRRLDTSTPLEEFLELKELGRLLAGAKLKSAVSAELKLDSGRLRGALAEAFGAVVAAPANARIAALVAGIADAVRARKRDDAVLTFDDLITETRTLLASHPAVRDRYARRFRAIMVDEFQDTDRVQAEVVRRLREGSPAPLLFVVGDEKQSIYRFRGADVSVFHEVSAELGKELPLGTNFRSTPPVLAFVNALAEAILRVPPDGEAAHWTQFDASQRLVPFRAAKPAVAAVRLVSFGAEQARRNLNMAEARELEARALANVVARLHDDEGIAYGSIAMLFRAFTEVKMYENALRRREVPYYVVKGRGFFQCQEVRDVTSLLGTLLDAKDGISLAAVLRSPLFAIDDDTLWRLAWPEERERPDLTRRFRSDETFDDLGEAAPHLRRVRDLLLHLRSVASRATVAEVIEETCAATDFEAVCLTQFQGTQKVANVRKLIELAREWERQRFFTLRDFVRTVRRLGATEPREPEAPLVSEGDDVVRLMTIHQAKGLEFDAVVIPDLARAPQPDNRTVMLDDERGVVSGPIDATGRIILDHAGLARYREREKDRSRAEYARLFYVACTRARDVLVLSEGKGSASNLSEGKGDPHNWCHQVWKLVGPERVAAFVNGADEEATFEIAGEATVRVEKAARYLGATEREQPPMPEPRAARATEHERGLVARVLDFRPPVPSEVTTTPTALADFRRCPRQYWYRHVLSLPERGSGGTRATLLGNAAHGVLEVLDPTTADESEITRRLVARPEALVLRPSELEALGSDLRAAAAMLAKDIAAGFEVVGREVPFVLPLPAPKPRLFLHGRIDLLGRRGATAVVRDYKYARPASTSLESYGAQLGAYRLAAGGAQVEAELVFLRGGTTVQKLPAFDAVAEEETLVRAADGLARAVAAGGFSAFPRRPGSPAVCEALGCGYVRRCWGTGGVTRTASGPRSDSVSS
jgi:ATP-dependent helicase/nuclease subunit A